MAHNCRKCSTPLAIGENITQYQIDTSQYLCSNCRKDYNSNHHQDYIHRTGRHQPMSENKDCPAFLGVHIAERVLSHMFKDVERTPYATTGFDFRCRHGYLIDVKCSCRRQLRQRADQWLFHIVQNTTADFFLCLAFDNRHDLKPEHIWLIPGSKINDHVSAGISETRLDRWAQYEQPIEHVCECCNMLRDIGGDD